MRDENGMVTMVLVHGAGDTADVWSKVQDALSVSSLALDLPGRGRNPSDLSRVTVDLAVRQAVTDIVELSSGPIVLVAHSMGGAVSPGILARLGERIVHLVHIAAVAGAEGELPLAVASMEFVDHILANAENLRKELRGASFADAATTLPAGLRAMDDRGALARIDSLNLGCTPTSWAAVELTIPRTYIQPLRDRIYPPDAQERLAAALHADEVVRLDVGHNVARSSPRELAEILSGVATRHL
jgi:pimeloyl-ACP methyl ester carboxylesterase